MNRTRPRRPNRVQPRGCICRRVPYPCCHYVSRCGTTSSKSVRRCSSICNNCSPWRGKFLSINHQTRRSNHLLVFRFLGFVYCCHAVTLLTFMVNRELENKKTDWHAVYLFHWAVSRNCTMGGFGMKRRGTQYLVQTTRECNPHISVVLSPSATDNFTLQLILLSLLQYEST